MNHTGIIQSPASGLTPIRMLALPGSLRLHSFNRRLCDAATERVPAGVSVETFDDLAAIPLFNEDAEADDGNVPAAVLGLSDAIAQADGLLIATPEYNQSVPGVLKNSLDWLSRPCAGDVLAGKPVAVIGATSGPWGTRLAQTELRHIMQAIGAQVLVEPMLFVRDAGTLFDASGNLVAPPTRMKLTTVLESFASWIERLGDPRPVRRMG